MASVEHGKVLVGAGKTFEVGNHDFTRCLLTPCVALLTDIPDLIEGSFDHGRVCVGMKVSAFEPSSPLHHATEFNFLLTRHNDKNPILLLYRTVDLTVMSIYFQCSFH